MVETGRPSEGEPLSRPTGKGTIFHQDSGSRRDKCSLTCGYQAPSLPDGDSLTLIRKDAPMPLDARDGSTVPDPALRRPFGRTAWR
ncbi:hypothetical protein Mro03_57650 [Microbispora rosea subsp. rosea]|nr:hypothetical protein Mro03_57650 [Microbispora rosea subsp. rosea]